MGFFRYPPTYNRFACDCSTLSTRIYLLIALSDFEQTLQPNHAQKRFFCSQLLRMNKKRWKIVSAIKINSIHSCCLCSFGVCQCFINGAHCLHSIEYFLLAFALGSIDLAKLFFRCFFLPLAFSIESSNIRRLCVYFNAIVWMEFIQHHDYMLTNNGNAIIRIPCHTCVSFGNSLCTIKKSLPTTKIKIRKLAISQLFWTFFVSLLSVFFGTNLF